MHCTVCDGEAALFLHYDDMRIYRCASCRHCFSDTDFPETEVYSEEYFLATHKNWFANPDRAYFSRLAGLIATRHDTGSAIIDVGCGTGNLLRFLQQAGHRNLTGTDIIDNILPGISYRKGDFLTLGFPGTYDVVISTGTIEHIKDPHVFMQKILGLLSPGGTLIIMTINEHGLIYQLAKAMFRYGHSNFAVRKMYDRHHVNHFHDQSLRRLVETEAAAAGITLRQHLRIFHNFPFRAIDAPPGLAGLAQKTLVSIIFILSALANRQMLQTQVFVRT